MRGSSVRGIVGLAAVAAIVAVLAGRGRSRQRVERAALRPQRGPALAHSLEHEPRSAGAESGRSRFDLVRDHDAGGSGAERDGRRCGALDLRDPLRRSRSVLDLRERDADRRRADRRVVARPGLDEDAAGRPRSVSVRHAARSLQRPTRTARRAPRQRRPVRGDRRRHRRGGLPLDVRQVRRLLRRGDLRAGTLRTGRERHHRVRRRRRLRALVQRDRVVGRRSSRAPPHARCGPRRGAARLSPAEQRAHVRHEERHHVPVRQPRSAVERDPRPGPRRLLRALGIVAGRAGLALARPARSPGPVRARDRRARAR